MSNGINGKMKQRIILHALCLLREIARLHHIHPIFHARGIARELFSLILKH